MVNERLLSKIVWKKFESKSQHHGFSRCRFESCYQRSFEKSLKANHNLPPNLHSEMFVVIKDRLKKVWKQITTGKHRHNDKAALLSKIVWKKFESKSQQWQVTIYMHGRCYQRSFEKSLKANHNRSTYSPPVFFVVIKDRLKKVWKQITTPHTHLAMMLELLSKIVWKKFESKSQQTWKQYKDFLVVIKDRLKKVWKQITTKKCECNYCAGLLSKIVWKKFESKSQQFSLSVAGQIVVIKDRLKKVWKQITTDYQPLKNCYKLLSKIVWKKFESKSQLYLTIQVQM